MSVINHADANPQPPAWPRDNLSPGRAPTLLLQAGGGNWDLARWDHAGMGAAPCGGCCWGLPTSLWGRSVEQPAQGGSTGTFGCVATPPRLSPISLWDLSITKERHRGVCSSLGCPSSAGRWPSCFQVGAQGAKAKPPAPAPGVPAVIHHRAGCTQQTCSSLTQRSWCWLQGRTFFFFF